MATERSYDKPLEHDVLMERGAVRPQGRAERADVTLLDISLKGVSATQVIQEKGRLRVVANVGRRGLRRRKRYRRIPAISLSAEDVDDKLATLDVPGHIPDGIATRFTPRTAKPTHALPVEEGEGLDRGGTIFGTDDRYLFNDISFPWRTTGKVRTAGGWGSGTTIGPRLVLTASHVINWTGGGEDTVGWATFTPAYYDGSGPWGTMAATQVIYWLQAPGSLTDQQTAFDYAILVMEDRIGDVIGYPGYRTYDDDWNDGRYWQYIGYPGERSSGERPAFQGSGVVSSIQNQSFSGRTGYVMGHFNEFTPGQSGGAIWGWWGDEPWPRVVGVGSTIGDTIVRASGTTANDNEYGGGPALSALISWARSNFP